MSTGNARSLRLARSFIRTCGFFNASADPDARRAFLAGRIERVIYRKYQVTIVGAVPLPSIDGDEVKKAAFRIEAEIDIEAAKSRPRPAKPGDGHPKYASASPAVSGALHPALVIGAEVAITLESEWSRDVARWL